MKRNITYTLLALPLIVFAVYFLSLPRHTRQTFLSEFKHRTAALFGYAAEASDGPQGLRIERPEEYGLPHDGVEGPDGEASEESGESDELATPRAESTESTLE